MAIGLGVVWREVVQFNPPLFIEILELKADELRAIVGDYLFWNSKVADDALLYKVLDFAVVDLVEGLC